MNWDAFLMGISDFGLERLKEERQAKMQKDLLELQQKYARESAEFTQRLKDESDAKRVSNTIETEDGTMRDVNVFGEQIGEDRELSPFARREREMAEEKHESDINYRNRQLDIQQDQVNAIRERTASAARASAPELDAPEVGLSDIMDHILAPYKNVQGPQQAQMRNLARKVAGQARNMPAEAGMTKLETASMLFDMEVAPLLGGVGGARPTGP